MAGNSSPRTTGADTPRAIGAGGKRRSGPPDTSVAGHRRGGAARPSRLRSVRTQLLAPIAVAMIGLAVLSTAQATTATSAAQDAVRARTLASTATSAVGFVYELEREVAETAALRQRGGKSGVSLVVAQRQRTDAAAARYLNDSRAAVKAVPALELAVRAVSDIYSRLGATREAADTNPAVTLMTDPVYRPLAEALLAIADAVPAQIADIELANAARAVASVGAIEHFAALERDLLRAVFSRGAVDPGDLGAMSELRGARDQRLAEFQRAATLAGRTVYDDEIRGMDVDRAEKLSAAARNAEKEPEGLKVDADTWFVAQSGFIRRLNTVSLDLSDRLDGRAEQIAVTAQRRAWATIIGTALIGLAALAIAITLAVRTARRLRRLRAAALTVARQELPDVIHSVTTGAAMPTGTAAAAATRSIAATNDEIGQVADAFATVHRTALRLAGEQAELRVDVSRMAEVLARRIRTLITRQLRLLDEFERDETDPDVLARLFALDHIAARLRRNGENLLVLSGGEPGRPATQAVGIGAVITAAASEIEDFQRVEVQPADLAIAGPVVGDLVHLLAELLENATAFSPPTQQVRVDARPTVDGAIIRVHDSGIGIAPRRLAEINSRLATPTTLSSAAAGTMGLHVVSHLAARHRIRVELHATGTGTVAYVALPHRALERVSALPPSTVTSAPVTSLAAAPVSSAPVSSAPVSGVPVSAAPVSSAPISAVPVSASPRPGPPPVVVPSTVGAPLGRPRVPQPAVPAPAAASSAFVPPPPAPPAPAPPARPAPSTRPAPLTRPASSASPPSTFSAPPAVPGPPASSGPPAPWFRPYLSGGETPQPPASAALLPPAPGAWPPRSGVLSSAGGAAMTEGDLPRRRPGAQLAPGATEPQPPPTRSTAVDPETVRSRLSAFAEGVSAAARRRNSTTPGQKDQ
ncbi:sensor histidine kinase [Dactylosporangium aurantiacum]|uniref:sensor histidine kinase n=1 Tax=Dactylosporangium aurantiacum TaxID=35754 RepID=UPI001FDF60A4|nr:nitrate- and nitrite sensing domain-containing protein [Dactylosporangium aurantiacum]MDG6107400.1 nitrate- and nitrite sensing domain-containing protein [Dactylosporangium aurantiacum]